MGTNVNLTDILAKIAANADFLKSAGNSFEKGEKIEALFISGGDKADTLVLQDTSGDNYTVSAQSVSGILTDTEYKALMGKSETIDEADIKEEIPIEIGKTDSTTATAKTGEVENVEGTAATGSSAEIQKKIEALKTQKAANQEVMTSLQNQITELKEKVQQAIADALDAMEDAKEEQKERAEKITADKINDFEKRIKDGEDISPADLSANVAAAIQAEGMPISYQNAVSKLLFADTNVQLMNNLLGQLSDKIQVDKDIDSQIGTQEELYDKAKEAEEAAAAAAKSSCDPIGFQMDGIDTDGDGIAGNVQFDFFYDKDDDGQINSLDDFVGAKADKAGKDGWDEMENIDGAGGEKDGKITSDELSNAGMKVMVTDENGKQYAMKIEDFEEKFGKIEIGAQDTEAGEDGFVDGVGPKGFNQDADNKLLSSFSLKVGGKDLSGYQTSDTQDWLINNYKSVMDMDSINTEKANGTAATGEAGELNEFETFFDEYKNTVMPQLQKQVNEAYEKLGELGFSGEFRTSLKQLAATSASAEGTKIKAENDEKEKKAAEEADELAAKEEAALEAQVEPAVEVDAEDKDLKKDEEEEQ